MGASAQPCHLQIIWVLTKNARLGTGVLAVPLTLLSAYATAAECYGIMETVKRTQGCWTCKSKSARYLPLKTSRPTHRRVFKSGRSAVIADTRRATTAFAPAENAWATASVSPGRISRTVGAEAVGPQIERFTVVRTTLPTTASSS